MKPSVSWDAILKLLLSCYTLSDVFALAKYSSIAPHSGKTLYKVAQGTAARNFGKDLNSVDLSRVIEKQDLKDISAKDDKYWEDTWW